MRAPVLLAAALAAALVMPAAIRAEPLFDPLRVAVAAALREDDAVAAFYRARDFAPIWTGEGAERRRHAFVWALEAAADHGLPADRHDPASLRDEFAAARTLAEVAELDVRTTRRFLRYAQDVSTGVLDPAKVDPEIKLDVPVRDRLEQLDAFAYGDPHEFVRDLWPRSPAYLRLVREKLRLEDLRAQGGWGPEVAAERLEPGEAGAAVAALRDRLARMGYLRRSAIGGYDAALTEAVRTFQTDHGLEADGIAGPRTLAALNVPVEGRVEQILVALERQRWMNKPLEERHVLVNLAEFRAYVVDDGRVTFDTDVVVGAQAEDRRTPEFSDLMDHIVINPSWYVPRSIAVNEYLPALRRGGARHLEVYFQGGRVDPRRVDFSRYTARTFPFSLRQPPGPANALGKVKFMFPNAWNIYLHDTPARDLFAREIRTFSHGCVRVERPEELARHLLAAQEADPRAFFDGVVARGAERRVNLERPVGVHLVYWSAWVTPTGRANYRGDPYGRDAKVLAALRAAGVALPERGG